MTEPGTAKRSASKWLKPKAETTVGSGADPSVRFCVLHPYATGAGIRYGHPLRRVPGLPSDPAKGPRHKIAHNAVENNPLLTLRARRRRAKRVCRGDRSSEGTTAPPCRWPLTPEIINVLLYSKFTGILLAMYTRYLRHPKDSILLLGPRGTGKSTWIRQNFPKTLLYDLLNTTEALRLSKVPSLLFDELSHLQEGSWVIIDEVQKVPALLDEVHRLIETRRLRFILSGSSARKLRKGGSNLLAGRAALTQLFPLTSAEVGFQIKIPRALEFGMLPQSLLQEDPHPYLRTYAEMYLEEEIKQEALTRNIGGFARFLEVAARQNGQITNVSNIARDAQVARPTVQGYFDILKDTLIGSWLIPWKLKRATKQIAHPKFYFFDTGVVRALSGRLPYASSQEELGPLLETFLLQEIRAYLSYTGRHYPVHFWRSPDGVEVDIFCEGAKGYFAIECKASPRWDTRYERGLKRMQEEFGATKVHCIGIYTGMREMRSGSIRILPVLDFLKELWGGEIFV